MTQDSSENGRPFRRYFLTRYLIDAFNKDLDERFYDSFKTTWFANDTTHRFNVNKSASINTDTGLIYIYTVRYTNATGQTVLYDSLLYNSNTGSGRFMVGPKYIRSDIDNLHKNPKVSKGGKLLFELGDTAIHFIKGEFDNANQLVNVSSGHFFHDTHNY